MSLLNVVKSKSFWLGAGAVLLYEYYPEISKKARPVLIGLIKTGYRMTEELKTIVEQGKEAVDDMVAEAKAQQEEPVEETKQTTTARKQRAPKAEGQAA